MVSFDALFTCPEPHQYSHDGRHICDSRPDYDRPFLNDQGRVNYPMKIMTFRCLGCGCALTSCEDGKGRWARYLLEEEPM